jgi:hypothetical protein
MKRTILIAVTGLAILATSHLAVAGKRDGTKCRNSQSCSSKACIRTAPGDKFGTCCERDTCASLSYQCGFAGDGCEGELDCGTCGEGFRCTSNQCESTQICGGFETREYDGLPDSSYLYSCGACYLDGCTLHCTCYPNVGDPKETALDLSQCDPVGGIWNDDGNLGCQLLTTTTVAPSTTIAAPPSTIDTPTTTLAPPPPTTIPDAPTTTIPDVPTTTIPDAPPTTIPSS